ncbi:MAG: bifunctional pyr operon transcriptional regulator/uracil phosphoribosyltransferase PyrR [Clostridia bacterium]|nr:bifunctional pyr operon transcriptional regulator/uracil phosphoribosyltransferase PyrR [Clostridia bacterium]
MSERQIKAALMDENAVNRALIRITHEIVEKNKGCHDLCLIGIHRRGVPLAQILHENLFHVDGTDVPVGALDITMYRDDLSERSDLPAEHTPLVEDKPLAVDIQGKTVVLVDDVIYTGRTVRAAIEALFRQGRPAAVQLAVLVDRGHRELPFRPDYVGKNVPTAREEIVDVHMTAIDGDTGVYLY